MANRSYLYAAKSVPQRPGEPVPVMGLGECRYDIPALFCALMSGNPRACPSILFDEDEPFSIIADAAAGRQRLQELRGEFADGSPEANTLDEAITFLSRPYLAEFPYFLLELAELFVLDSAPIAEQSAAELARIGGIGASDLKGIKPEDFYWTHILYYEPTATVAPPIYGQSSIQATPAEILASADQLKDASPYRVRLTVVPGDDALAPALTALSAIKSDFTLELSGTLDTVPMELCQLQNVSNLVLRGLGLTSLPLNFSAMSGLRDLFIGDNRFDEVPGEVFELENLRALSVSRSPIAALPERIANLKTLDSLYLDGCGLTALPDAISQLHSLQMLDISNNPGLTRLPDDVSGWRALEQIKANNSGLTSLPRGLGRLPKLARLYLAGNQIRKVPLSIRQARLEVINLEGSPVRRGLLGFRAEQVFIDS